MDFNFSTPEGTVMDPPKHFNNNPPSALSKQLRRYRVLVDSTYRNTSQTITDYIYALDIPFFGVERIELMRAFFPNSLYLITGDNNTLSLTVAGTPVSFDIPVGNYTASELASAIQDGLDTNAAGSWPWTVATNTTTSKLEITSTTNDFSYDGSVNVPLSLILGFGTGTYSSTSSALVSPFPVNTSYPQNIVLSISDGTENFDSMIVPTNSSSENVRCFSYIPLGVGSAASLQESAATVIVSGSGNVGGHGYFYIPKDATNSYYDFYEGARGSIKRLIIKLRQILPDGTLVVPDFNNANHIIEFEILAKTDKISYTL